MPVDVCDTPLAKKIVDAALDLNPQNGGRHHRVGWATQGSAAPARAHGARFTRDSSRALHLPHGLSR
jgi:hypothetical protein